MGLSSRVFHATWCIGNEVGAIAQIGYAEIRNKIIQDKSETHWLVILVFLENPQVWNAQQLSSAAPASCAQNDSWWSMVASNIQPQNTITIYKTTQAKSILSRDRSGLFEILWTQTAYYLVTKKMLASGHNKLINYGQIIQIFWDPSRPSWLPLRHLVGRALVWMRKHIFHVFLITFVGN